MLARLVLLVTKVCCKVDSQQPSGSFIFSGSREEQKAGQGKRVHAEKKGCFSLAFCYGNQRGAEDREQKKKCK